MFNNFIQIKSIGLDYLLPKMAKMQEISIFFNLLLWKLCGNKRPSTKARNAAWPWESHFKQLAKVP